MSSKVDNELVESGESGVELPEEKQWKPRMNESYETIVLARTPNNP